MAWFRPWAGPKELHTRVDLQVLLRHVLAQLDTVRNVEQFRQRAVLRNLANQRVDACATLLRAELVRLEVANEGRQTRGNVQPVELLETAYVVGVEEVGPGEQLDLGQLHEAPVQVGLV